MKLWNNNIYVNEMNPIQSLKLCTRKYFRQTRASYALYTKPLIPHAVTASSSSTYVIRS